MCIRDSESRLDDEYYSSNTQIIKTIKIFFLYLCAIVSISDCLLYTSDAADERSSVDLGGRRIIKKKTHIEKDGHTMIKQQHIGSVTQKAST